MASLMMNAVRLALKAAGKPMNKPARYLAERENREDPIRVDPPSDIDVSYNEIGESAFFRVTPPGPLSNRMIYFHGGAFVNPMRKVHWRLIARLGEVLRAEMIVASYPLAPQNDHRPAHAQARALLQAQEDRPFLMGGDSAGGNLALAMALAGRAGDVPKADRLILLAPWLDLTCANPKGPALEPKDPIIGLKVVRQCGKWWAGPEDPRAPHLSPLFGPVDGLPPIDIHQGTADLCWPDASDYATRLAAAGNTGRYYEYPGAIHVFPAVTFLPESKLAYRRIERDALGS